MLICRFSSKFLMEMIMLRKAMKICESSAKYGVLLMAHKYPITMLAHPPKPGIKVMMMEARKLPVQGRRNTRLRPNKKRKKIAELIKKIPCIIPWRMDQFLCIEMTSKTDEIISAANRILPGRLDFSNVTIKVNAPHDR